ncbi:MAG TPA: efflux RND transporter periplasmic adaptor subunit [Planctomycetaceae bacterium]|jgi:HlyD family secretion protein|nr:efflux RND transporter periplasmic adaptor subunit [Planctomycetaceae bacterium]
MIKSLFFLVVLAGIVGAGAAWYIHETADQPSTFRTVATEHGNLLATINATAVIEAEEVVDVGAQIAGMVQAFGHDLKDSQKAIDYGSQVEVGTVLAQIDPRLYKATLHQAQANLDNSLAMLEQAKTNLKLSQLNWDRAQTLHDRKVMSQADYDSSQADLETKKPALAAANAAVEMAKASLETAQTNVDYCTITSPVKGVIVDRRVNMGQTVVSSLSAPSLFLIARDLTRMQLWASVNEADIGQIHPGQSVQFTVDAFPNQTFRGEVSQIRLNANMTQNVVTYTVVVTTDNTSGRLLPYMTANVKFEVAKRNKVLLVPSAALRWKPQPNQIVADAREAYMKASRRREGRPDRAGKSEQGAKPEQTANSASKGEEPSAAKDESASKDETSPGDESASESKDGESKDGQSPANNGDGRSRTKRGERGSGKNGTSKKGDVHAPRKHNGSRREKPTVWVDEDGFARPIQIETGLTDGTQVEVISGDLKEGTQVIVGETRREEVQTKNPFVPAMFRGGNRPKEKDKDK